MEAGKYLASTGEKVALDLVDAMVAAADDKYSDAEVDNHRTLSLSHLRLMLGHVHGELNELPDGSAWAFRCRATARPLATHADRQRLFLEAGHLIVDITRRYYEQNDASRVAAQCRQLQGAFENAMTLDIAMGGSTNTVLHILAIGP